METTFDRVRRVVCEVMTISPERVTPATDIVADLGPDSLEQMEILMGLETEFGMDLEHKMESLGVVNDVVRVVEEELALYAAAL